LLFLALSICLLSLAFFFALALARNIFELFLLHPLPIFPPLKNGVFEPLNPKAALLHIFMFPTPKSQCQSRQKEKTAELLALRLS
jgi:hypothetical protein